ncbi:hypothetical protein [uncultured Salinicola sp.]|uniref:hypothetical protein n=1 Tax=uncultured Salinicola sp. TaxID=1193542 RepID=UPI00262279B8|nr:hypothetical protein [uncultured Salinicola sp.]
MADMDRLRTLLTNMDVPNEKAKIADERDIQWLGRNLGLRNSDHPDIEEARGILESLGARLVM